MADNGETPVKTFLRLRGDDRIREDTYQPGPSRTPHQLLKFQIDRYHSSQSDFVAGSS